MVLKFDRNSRQSSRRDESAGRSLTAHKQGNAAEGRQLARLLGIQPDELTEGAWYHTAALLAIERAYGIDSTAGAVLSPAREVVFAALGEYFSAGQESVLADLAR